MYVQNCCTKKITIIFEFTSSEWLSNLKKVIQIKAPGILKVLYKKNKAQPYDEAHEFIQYCTLTVRFKWIF
jgi:hypothetical protein